MTLVIIVLIFCSAALAQDDPMRGPWGEGVRREAPGGEKASFRAGTAPVRFYRKYLSPIDGSRCAMHPSCSEYSLQAFEKHGFFMGWIMTMDRLFRCGRDELKLSPWVRIDGEMKCYDPVQSNDFWWNDGE